MSIWGSYENLAYEIFYWLAYTKIRTCPTKITRYSICSFCLKMNKCYICSERKISS